MKDRVDKVLVATGLASTRSQASLLVKEGVVYYNNTLVKKTSLIVEGESLEVRKDNIFVGRGAHKIEGALEEFNVDPQGMIVADVGASTGGFTDYILQKGASKVFAIDVGHGQLAKSLREDSRVINMEGVNIRYELELDEKVDLAVVDLSYISLKLTLDTIHSLVKDNGSIIALVKPQFEVGKENVGKGGIVRSDEARLNSLESLYAWCSEKKYFIKEAMVSPIKGKTGNTEYFFYFDRSLSDHELTKEELRNL
ncbi:TlyA family rRNA (cytidine-2'-O)-methyltransferase [Halobacteriovorax marinus]|uniref:RNA methyltransferase n=1 Tax=Halobacteriovorax marinus (strain ATCC BAA-682 / DSM 15412 / SJ) TaxID=862908 RepID=E1WZF7_HALMS|nr:TlyA family RNA methyltransferase [Halobacteriovorax marinus]ATH09132.1 TlyA family rRNA (cytidine-2'-O)-methyltransferase [Halobacteriovorax marinus]CBW27846.1 putative RNA methyltransferase [Halobacteriovorax marinus SJ]